MQIGALDADLGGRAAHVAAAATQRVGEKLPLQLLDRHVADLTLERLELVPGGRQRRGVQWRSAVSPTGADNAVAAYDPRRTPPELSLCDIAAHREPPICLFSTHESASLSI